MESKFWQGKISTIEYLKKKTAPKLYTFISIQRCTHIYDLGRRKKTNTAFWNIPTGEQYHTFSQRAVVYLTDALKPQHSNTVPPAACCTEHNRACCRLGSVCPAQVRQGYSSTGSTRSRASKSTDGNQEPTISLINISWSMWFQHDLYLKQKCQRNCPKDKINFFAQSSRGSTDAQMQSAFSFFNFSQTWQTGVPFYWAFKFFC